jgi:hypothetical protein
VDPDLDDIAFDARPGTAARRGRGLLYSATAFGVTATAFGVTATRGGPAASGRVTATATATA